MKENYSSNKNGKEMLDEWLSFNGVELENGIKQDIVQHLNSFDDEEERYEEMLCEVYTVLNR